MTILTWPSELPKPDRDGYQRQIDDPRGERPRDTGPRGWKRRWSSVSKSVSLTIDVDRSQKAVFDRFYEDNADFGSSLFWMPDPTTDGWPLLMPDGQPLLMHDGTPLLMAARWLCLFGKPVPSETVRGIRFKIAFNVTVMP
nr:hypothetical protein [Marinicella sp. W31]MDC2878323.1 hypothetical protein [Marinicella sp. W31]